MARGKLITFEGIDGSGKTTQIKFLADYLRSLGFDVLLLREPGGTRIGEEIRHVLLDMRSGEMTSETELFLFEAARAQLVREVIRPALEKGSWVISDRFHDSSVAYQGYGRGLPIELVRALNDMAIGETVPDLTILLELGPETRAVRLGKRHGSGLGDRIDLETERFKERVCQGFRAIAQAEPERVVRIESLDEKEKTAELIRHEVRRYLL
ncbi:MAG TPA: dTMP kinase [Bacillota bacterium]|jgi:dTMP kinase|nr:dTMP kinase [Fastidiosipila sp.]HPX93427.1 dTMP kinase [Bacillota bacterium]HQB81199.1 dTMP kinase [Bacillota bacterium]